MGFATSLTGSNIFRSRLLSSCGACRQVLHEFAPHLEILAARQEGDYQVYILDELLPNPFQFNPEKGR